MKAIILAAGRGSRVGTRTDMIPKCLLPVSGKPLLAWQMEALQGAGITDIAIVRGYLKEKVSWPGLQCFENPNWAATQMVQTLCCASEWLEKDDVIVSYADIIYPASTIQALLGTPGDVAIPYNTEWRPLWEKRFDDPLADAETFRVDDQGILVEIGNRARSMEEIKGQYMGLLKFSPAGWKRVETFIASLPPEKQPKTDMTTLLRGLIQAGEQIQTVPIAGNWFEVDNERDLQVCEAHFATRS